MGSLRFSRYSGSNPRYYDGRGSHLDQYTRGFICGCWHVCNGLACNKVYKTHPGAIAWVPALGLALSIPFYVFAARKVLFAALGLIIGGFVKYGYIAAQYTIGQGVVTMRVRAMAIAVLLFIANLVGYGFGPCSLVILLTCFLLRELQNLALRGGACAKPVPPQSHRRIKQHLQDVCGSVYVKAYNPP